MYLSTRPARALSLAPRLSCQVLWRPFRAYPCLSVRPVWLLRPNAGGGGGGGAANAPTTIPLPKAVTPALPVDYCGRRYSDCLGIRLWHRHRYPDRLAWFCSNDFRRTCVSRSGRSCRYAQCCCCYYYSTAESGYAGTNCYYCGRRRQ